MFPLNRSADSVLIRMVGGVSDDKDTLDTKCQTDPGRESDLRQSVSSTNYEKNEFKFGMLFLVF
jgi:hypothetical protein